MPLASWDIALGLLARAEDGTRGLIIMVGLAVAAIIFVGGAIYAFFSPTERAVKKARDGDIAGAEDDLKARISSKGGSAGLHRALGQVYLLGDRPHEAVHELRKAYDMGSTSTATQVLLGWALVESDQFAEAVPCAEYALRKSNEDLDAYCLYCAVMAHNGRADEAQSVYNKVIQVEAELQQMNPRLFDGPLGKKLAIVHREMSAAGLA